MKRNAKWLSVVFVIAAACGGGGKKDTRAGGDPAGGGDPVAGTGTTGAGGTAPALPPAKGNPSNDVIDRKVFFGNPERTQPKISPDGKFLAWLAPKDGVMNVWVAPVNDLAKGKPITTDTTRPVRQYLWAYDKKHLLYMQDKGGDENFHVWRVNPSTGGEAVDLTPIDGAKAQLIGLSPRRPGVLLVGLNDRDPRHHDVWSIDIASGQKTRTYENKDGYIGFEVDLDLELRFASKVLPDGAGETFMRDKKGAWKSYETIPKEDTANTNAAGFDKKGTARYMIDSRDRDTGAFYQVDIKSKKKRLIYGTEKADVSGALIHPTEQTVQAVAYTYDRQKWHVVDKKIKADFDGIGKLVKGDDFAVTSRTLDDKTWVVTVYGDTAPPSFYLWDRKKKAGTFLFASRPELADKPLVPMHPVIIKSRDGLDLVSYLSLPNAADGNKDGKAEKQVPAVLLVHGGPWARDGWGPNPLHQLLANRGYAVLSVNFRGSTGFGKKFVNAGNGEWGKKMHDDLVDAAKWLVEQNVAPADKIGIMGGSYGGYSTLAGLTLTPDVFACGVDIVGPSSIITLIESIPPYWAPFLAQFKQRVGDWTTPEGKQALLAVSPITHVDKIKKPLLIGQGANDPRVKQAESDQIVKAMVEKRIPVTYVLFPDEGHGFARPENNLAFMAVAEAFLSAHLGGVYQPLAKEDFASSSIQIKQGKEGIPGWPM